MQSQAINRLSSVNPEPFFMKAFMGPAQLVLHWNFYTLYSYMYAWVYALAYCISCVVFMELSFTSNIFKLVITYMFLIPLYKELSRQFAYYLLSQALQCHIVYDISCSMLIF